MRSQRRGLISAIALVAFVMTGCAAPQPAPQPTVKPSSILDEETLSAAGWLQQQISDSGIVHSEFEGASFPDYGLTLDVVMALTAVAAVQDLPVPADVVEAGEALATEENVVAYTTYDKDRYAGATAKLAAVLDLLGYDPSDVGGVDLMARLSDLQLSSGQFADHAQEDYTNTVTQSWGVMATAQYGGDVQAATDFLAAQQCEDGGFSATFVDADGQCTSDPDSTAFAVSALVVAQQTVDGATVDNAVLQSAGDYLDSQANEETVGRSWNDAVTGEPNVNTTAVVTTALKDAGHDTFTASQAYLLSLLHNAPGGVFQVNGNDDARATAQGVLALSGLSFSDMFVTSEPEAS